MKPMQSDWYRKIWTLEIQDQSWVEDTARQVDFLAETLHLRGGEKILDLACGFGRHSLELARRGFDVTGVDITPAYIAYAAEQAERERLNARFLCCDIREVQFTEEFDAVISMADGAIGYLENDAENLKIFQVIARALKKGGRHFMDIMNAGYADTHFPCRMWEAGKKCLTLSSFEWDKETRIMLYGQLDFPYGTALPEPRMEEGNPIRLYTIEEVGEIYAALGMQICGTYAAFDGTPSSDSGIQLMVSAQKLR